MKDFLNICRQTAALSKLLLQSPVSGGIRRPVTTLPLSGAYSSYKTRRQRVRGKRINGKRCAARFHLNRYGQDMPEKNIEKIKTESVL